MTSAFKRTTREILKFLVSGVETDSELAGVSFGVSGRFPQYGGKDAVLFLLQLAGATASPNLTFHITVDAEQTTPMLWVDRRSVW